MRLYLFPGLAADARLFGPQLEAFDSICVPAWIEPRPGESLRAYAGRLGSTLETGAPYAVGGFSFGGQVAQELARVLDPAPQAVVLMCGVRGRHHLRWSFRAQVRAGELVPRSWQRRLYPWAARRFASREGVSAGVASTLEAMARSIDPSFLRWSARACAGWPGVDGLSMPVHHVHGERDRVIPDVRGEATEVIPGAGHLITLTHPEAVNAALHRVLGGADSDNQVAR